MTKKPEPKPAPPVETYRRREDGVFVNGEKIEPAPPAVTTEEGDGIPEAE